MALSLFRRVQLRELRPRAQATPDNTILIEAGVYTKSTGTGVVRKSVAFNSPTFPVVSGGSVTRYDLVCLDDSGNAVKVAGTEVTSPGDPFADAPALPTDKLTIAIVRVNETATVVVDGSDITDVREFLNKGGGGGSGTSTSAKETITQASHGFAAKDVIYHTGTAYAKAKADAPVTAEAVGVVESVAGNDFTVVYEGRISSLSGLTAGSVCFVSEVTAGLLTTDIPVLVGSVSKPMLVATSTTSGVVINMRGTEVQLSGENQSPITYRPTPLTVGQTLITLPWSYTQGASRLIVFRNGVYLPTGIDYTETSSISITLVTAVAETDEEIIITRLPNGVATVFSAAPTIDEVFTATSGQTIFNLSTTYMVGANSLKVFRNGVLQTLGDDYNETDNDTVTLNVACNLGDSVRCLQFGWTTSNTVLSNKQTFTSTSGQTVYDLSFSYVPGANELLVSSGGVVMEVTVDYAETNGTRITFGTGRALNEVVVVRRIGASTAAALKLRELQTATASQTIFNLVGSYTANGGSLQVFRNGKLLMPTEYTETNSQTVTLATGADLGDEMLFMVAGGDVVSYVDAGVIAPEIQVGSASQTVFNLAQNFSPGSGGLAVYKNGVRLVNGTDYYETAQNQVTLVVAALAGDKLLFENRAKVQGANQGVQQWYMFPQPMTVGQTVFTLPWRYAPGTHQLKVWRNGQYQLVGQDYTETAANIITLLSGITVTTEELVVETIASASAGTRNHTFAFHEDATRMLPAGQSYKDLKMYCTSNTQVVVQTGTRVMADSWDDAMYFDADHTVDITVAGDNGLDTGAEAASTWYYVWAILNPVTRVTSAIISASTTAPTLPTGYTKKRLIGAVRNNGSSNFLQFRQVGDEVWYGDSTSNYNVGALTANTWASADISSSVPTAISSVADVSLYISAGGTGLAAYLKEGNLSGAASGGRYRMNVPASTALAAQSPEVILNGYLSVWATAATGSTYFYVCGFVISL